MALTSTRRAAEITFRNDNPTVLTALEGLITDRAAADLAAGVASVVATEATITTGTITTGEVTTLTSTDATITTGEVTTLTSTDATITTLNATTAIIGDGTFTAMNGETSALEAAQVTATVAAGTTVQRNGHVQRGLYRVVVAKEAFTAAALTEDVVLCTVPAKTRVVSVICDVTEVFDGTAGTLQFKVGKTAGGAEYLGAADVKSAPVLLGEADADLGASLATATAVQGGDLLWAQTDITVRLTSGTGDIGAAGVTNLTTGSATFYIVVERLA